MHRMSPILSKNGYDRFQNFWIGIFHGNFWYIQNIIGMGTPHIEVTLYNYNVTSMWLDYLADNLPYSR